MIRLKNLPARTLIKRALILSPLITLLLLFQNCNSMKSADLLLVDPQTSPTTPTPTPTLPNKKLSPLGINTGVFADQRLIDKLGDIGSWYYNYSPDPNRESYNSVNWANRFEKEFVPMISGKQYVFQNSQGQCTLTPNFRSPGSQDQVCTTQRITDDLLSMKKNFGPRNQPSYLIGFNEPFKTTVDPTSSGPYAIDPVEAAEAYGKIISSAESAGLKLTSPSISLEMSALNWMNTFLRSCYDRRNLASDPCLIEKIEILNVHQYDCSSSFWITNYKNRGLKNSLISRLGNYGGFDWSSYILNKKIWITETNCNWEQDFAADQREGKFSRNPTETCLRSTGQKAGHGMGSLYELQNMPEEIERFAWWNLYANPYVNSDLPTGVNTSSINRITAVRLYDENLVRTVNGDAYYQAYSDPAGLKSVNCSSKDPLVSTIKGLFKTQTGLIFHGFDDFYCRYDSINQVFNTYGPEWQKLLKTVREVPSQMEHAGACGPLQGLRKQNNSYYYTYKMGYTCSLADLSQLESAAGIRPAEVSLLKESNMSALGLSNNSTPCIR